MPKKDDPVQSMKQTARNLAMQSKKLREQAHDLSQESSRVGAASKKARQASSNKKGQRRNSVPQKRGAAWVAMANGRCRVGPRRAYSAVRTAWPATRPAHSLLKLRAYPLNVLLSGFRFLDRDNPADPLVACELRNILPLCSRRRVRNENFL